VWPPLNQRTPRPGDAGCRSWKGNAYVALLKFEGRSVCDSRLRNGGQRSEVPKPRQIVIALSRDFSVSFARFHFVGT
jgi:hypothetical protein